MKPRDTTFSAKHESLSRIDAAKIIQRTARAMQQVCHPVSVQCSTTPLRTPHHRLRVGYFNSLQLRKSALADQQEIQQSLIQTFAQLDVVLVSQLPAEEHIKDVTNRRAFGMKLLLDMFSHGQGTTDEHPIDDVWQMVLSEPSGLGNEEVHALFAKKPVTISRSTTNISAKGVPLDNAHFVVVVHDERFELPDNRTWAFSSVCMEQTNFIDVQLPAFLLAYSTNPEMRCGTPYTREDAKHAGIQATNHFIVGRFGCYPDNDLYRLKQKGFALPLFFKSNDACDVHDNVIVTCGAEKYFALNKTTLELGLTQTPSGQTSYTSCHSPILVSIHETCWNSPITQR